MKVPSPGPHAYEKAEEHLTRSDVRMAALIARIGPCRLPAYGPQGRDAYFEGLVSAIVSQQLSSKAAATIMARVRALALDEKGVVSPVTLRALPEADLRGAGLSGQKMRYLRDLSEHVVRGALVLESLHLLDDEAVIDSLCAVKGVGRWTAEMVLIFRLQRQDVLPVDDLGIQKGFQRLFALRRLPTAERMQQLGKRFRPYRSVACWYLWRLNEEKPTPR